MSLFAKIGKWLLIGGGTVLSAVGLPMVGGPLIVAGASINTGGSVDPMAGYAYNMQAGFNYAGALSQVQPISPTAAFFNNILVWIQQNFLIVIVAIGAIFLLKGRRRR